jgi:P-type conjugative transfer protein TrbJ
MSCFSPGQLQSSITQTQSLLSQAQKIAFNVQRVERAFTRSYGTAAGTGSTATMVTNAQTRWQNSVASFEDSLKVQAGLVGNIPTTPAR